MADDIDAVARPAERADYGLDAPGVIRNLLVIGGLMIAIGLGVTFGYPRLVRALGWLWISGLFVAAGGLAMVASSKWGKQSMRDRLLDGLTLKGDEQVLDLGCGHGLMLIGAAKRLTTGKAVGIDLWSQVDQADNHREATLRNARCEGVSDRVTLQDGDMRALPFPDQSFDLILASLSIHNIPKAEGRAQAVREAVRVLRPGGRLALLDFQKTGEYARTLRDAGISEVRRSLPSFRMYPPVRVVFGRKP